MLPSKSVRPVGAEHISKTRRCLSAGHSAAIFARIASRAVSIPAKVGSAERPSRVTVAVLSSARSASASTCPRKTSGKRRNTRPRGKSAGRACGHCRKASCQSSSKRGKASCVARTYRPSFSSSKHSLRKRLYSRLVYGDVMSPYQWGLSAARVRQACKVADSTMPSMSGNTCRNHISRSAAFALLAFAALCNKVSSSGRGEADPSAGCGISHGRMAQACTCCRMVCVEGAARKRQPEARATRCPSASSNSKSAARERLPL